MAAILINAHQIKKSFGANPLFEDITFSIETGERIGLIGPNGAGKSTLLGILAGSIAPDEGTLSLQRGLQIGYLQQVPKFTSGATVLATVLEGSAVADPIHDWEVVARAHEILSKLSLSGDSDVTPESLVETLSGGWKKRVALARELLREPDLLLLDEPTNHLDVESILWLEDLIAQARFATLTITHDRLFLQRISNRILELDKRNPHGLLSIAGDYATYLETKQAMMDAQEAQETRLRNTLRRETEWLRRGAKARTTKQQARIQRAGELKSTVEELNYRNQQFAVRMDFKNSERNPKKLIEAKNISKCYGNRVILPPLDLLISAGSRIGLLGPNGCGKSTLLRILLNQELPDTGSIQISDQVKAAFFEQNRETLDPDQTLAQAVCPSGDQVDYRGVRIHIKSYLDRFLFTSNQLAMPVKNLSGGEQSRLLLAKLMLQEVNLLVLDEPTNDLDIATLDVLQETLQDFNGAVILVTHDRYFLDQVAKIILGFGVNDQGNKEIIPFAGLQQWESWHAGQAQLQDNLARKQGRSLSADTESKSSAKKKLSFKEQRELDGMEENIQTREARLAELTADSTRPENILHVVRLTEITREMDVLQVEIERLYTRWAELEKR